jgi:hypothetical protein
MQTLMLTEKRTENKNTQVWCGVLTYTSIHEISMCKKAGQKEENVPKWRQDVVRCTFLHALYSCLAVVQSASDDIRT